MAGVLIPILGIIFGCGIALSAIWSEYKGDGALIERGPYRPEKTEPAGPLGRGFFGHRLHTGRNRHSLGCQYFCLSSRQGDRNTGIWFPVYWRCIIGNLFCCPE
jgi:hypothetical protein